MKEIYEEIIKVIAEGKSAALATVVSTKGSVPRHPGARMIVFPNKQIVGTIGGGTLEAEVIINALEVIKSNKSRLQSYGLIPKDKKGIGMTCGGTATVFIEPLMGPDRLLIVGAGHIAVPLADFAKRVGFYVTVTEDREEFLTKERFPSADAIEYSPVKKIESFIKNQKLQYVALINRNSACDADWLEAILQKQEAVYVGCIGSRMRLKTVGEQLKNRGVKESLIKTIHGPIGIEIGAETPEEIAISILAEIIAIRRKDNFVNRTK